MNRANVDALYRVIANPPAEWADWLTRPDPVRALAEYLASAGALMPEALTDADVERTHSASGWVDWECGGSGIRPTRFRAALARIAKGEP